MTSLLRKLSWLTRRRRKEAELEEEIRFHIEQEAADRRAAGLPIEQAQWAARRDIGNIALVRENTRAAWGWIALEQFVQDVRYAFRTMASNRLFTAVAVLSLALGIGANTAIFSFMDWILMRSLPVQDPDSLVVMNWQAKTPRPADGGRPTKVWHSMRGTMYGDPKTGLTAGIFPYPVFDLFRGADSVFSGAFAFSPAGKLNVSIKGQAHIASGEYVTGDYFRTLAVSSAAGRLLAPDDDRAGTPPVTVISFAFSQKHFGNPAAAAGQSILINSVPFTIAGVAPAEFFGVNPADAPDLYVPMQTTLVVEADPMASPSAKFLDRNHYWLQIMARLRPGVTLTRAQSTLETPFHQWVESTAANDEERANLPKLVLREGAGGLDALRRQFSKPLYVLMLLVSLILAIACANIANLLLARAVARRREIAMRLSVGAGKFRLVRQLLTESIVLGSLGGIVGVLFAVWGIRTMSLLLASGQTNFIPRAELNWNALVVAAALSLLTGLIFGVVPAIQATRVDVVPALKEVRANRAPLRIRVSLSHVLVVSQIAMSLLLLFAAGLFLRTLTNLQSVNIGFQRDHLLLFQLNAAQAGYRGPDLARFFADVRMRLKAIPGVLDASLSNRPLFTAGFALPVEVSGVRAKGTRLLLVGPDFFTTMRIPVVMGRGIEARDHIGSPQVAVVSELFARMLLGPENPVGRRLTMTKVDPREMEIVGVVKDVRYGGVKEALPPVVYMPYDQGSLKFIDEMTFVVHTAGEPLGYASAIRETVRQVDSRAPVANLITQQAQIDQTMYREIAFAKLCTAFALVALAIACVGLYGTVAYNVARRTSEIGIRLALGARQSSVVLGVFREVLILSLLGLAISVPAALAGSKFVESFLYGMKPNDPLTVVTAVLTLLAAALAAGCVPAWRASRIDPMTALRHE